MNIEYFKLVHKLNKMYEQLLTENEVHFRANEKSFSMISISQDKPELGITCRKIKYKSENDFHMSILEDLNEIKNIPASKLSKPEKKLQAWIIKYALNNNYQLPFDKDIKFITSELAFKNKAGIKIVTDILGYCEIKKQLCVIELKTDRKLKRLIEQVNNFGNVINENPVFFSDLLSLYGFASGYLKEITKIVVWPHEKTSPKEELKKANIIEIVYQDCYTFNNYLK